MKSYEVIPIQTMRSISCLLKIALICSLLGLSMATYEWLKEILAIYRLTLGKPRQEELIDSIKNEKLSKKDLEQLYMDWSPWERKRRK